MERPAYKIGRSGRYDKEIEKPIKAMVYLPADLKDRVTKKSVEKFGIHRGFLSRAVREALENWVKEK
jgi:hypothetical protein